MAKNILVISCDFRETRAALIEDGIIAELHIERKGAHSSTVGNVYLGKVTRVLPGLQAAFIDIGQERAAFLHVEDLIRPTDFDEYLAGGRKLARGEETAGPESEEETVDVASVEEAPAASEEAPEPRQPTSSDPGAIIEAHGGLGEDAGAELVAAAPALEPVVVPVEDLEATVSYPDWPEGAKARHGRSNGSSDARHTLKRESFAEAPSSAPLAESEAESEAEAEAAPSQAELDEAELDEAVDESSPALDEGSSPDLAASETSLDARSAPALDELPEGGSDVEPPDAIAGPVGEPDDDDDDDDDLLGDDDLPGFTVTEPGDPIPRAATPRGGERERGERGGRRRRGRGGRGRGEQPAAARGGRDGSGRSRGRDGGRGNGGRREARSASRTGGLPGRLSKSTPIREVVKEGQEILVQVTKDPIGTKGARCSSHISLPGRYVVYLPTVDHIGISKRIGNDKERARLREAIEAMKPPSGGLIVRTVAEGLTKKGLKQDVGYLVRLWGEIAKKREGARAPDLLSSELDLVLKVARDLFTDDVDEVVIDDKQQYERLRRFVEMFAPDRVSDVKLYDEEEPIFDEYGIEDEIGRALGRKVPLPSGGYLIIDQAEALTAIDVNTGRFVGKGSKDMEETILKTNLEAVQEIAYQLRFRNIGGLIILDLIDMEQHKSREKVRRKLEELLQKDKAKTTLNRISDLGLIEMTRKRTRESLGRLLHEPCFYCDGTGQLQSKETIAYEILREIRRKRSSLPGYSIVVNAHPAVADVLNGPEKAAVQDAENAFMRKIMIVSRKEYHLEQFDLQGK